MRPREAELFARQGGIDLIEMLVAMQRAVDPAVVVSLHLLEEGFGEALELAVQRLGGFKGHARSRRAGDGLPSRKQEVVDDGIDLDRREAAFMLGAVEDKLHAAIPEGEMGEGNGDVPVRANLASHIRAAEAVHQFLEPGGGEAIELYE